MHVKMGISIFKINLFHEGCHIIRNMHGLVDMNQIKALKNNE